MKMTIQVVNSPKNEMKKYQEIKILAKIHEKTEITLQVVNSYVS